MYLYLLLVVLVLIVGFLAYRHGKSAIKLEESKDDKTIADEQITIANNPPSKSDLIDKLRNNQF